MKAPIDTRQWFNFYLEDGRRVGTKANSEAEAREIITRLGIQIVK